MAEASVLIYTFRCQYTVFSAEFDWAAFVKICVQYAGIECWSPNSKLNTQSLHRKGKKRELMMKCEKKKLPSRLTPQLYQERNGSCYKASGNSYVDYKGSISFLFHQLRMTWVNDMLNCVFRRLTNYLQCMARHSHLVLK